MNKMIFAAALVLTAPTFGAVLYDNGAIVGTQGFGAPDISNGAVSDSFDLAAASTITGTANVGLWMTAGSLPVSVDWSINTAPNSGVLASGTATWSSTFLFTNAFNFDIRSGSFSIPSLSLAAGTYWLRLTNVVPNPTFWDRSGGPSQVVDGSTNISNSFQIIGTVDTTPNPNGVPEPGTGLLVLGAAIGIAGWRRLKG